MKKAILSALLAGLIPASLQASNNSDTELVTSYLTVLPPGFIDAPSSINFGSVFAGTTAIATANVKVELGSNSQYSISMTQTSPLRHTSNNSAPSLQMTFVSKLPDGSPFGADEPQDSTNFNVIASVDIPTTQTQGSYRGQFSIVANFE